MSVAIYVEGGGDSKRLRSDCRRGFGKFFEKAGLKGRMPKVRACGSRDKAFDQFSTAFDQSPSEGDTTLLLVDSEGPVAPGATPWSHLEKRDKWQRPPGVGDDNVHLMVQFMESWFLADKECLAEYFGSGFREASLPANPNVEEVPKSASPYAKRLLDTVAARSADK